MRKKNRIAFCKWCVLLCALLLNVLLTGCGSQENEELQEQYPPQDEYDTGGAPDYESMEDELQIAEMQEGEVTEDEIMDALILAPEVYYKRYRNNPERAVLIAVKGGVLNPGLARVIAENTPLTYTVPELPAEMGTSRLSACAGEPFEGEPGYDFLFNWEYPTRFYAEREEIFALLKEIDGVTLDPDENGWITVPGFVPVESRDDGTYQRVSPDANRCSEYYYGEMSGSRPHGKGVLLALQSEHQFVVPIYAGHFEEGAIRGYGMRFCGEADDYGRQFLSQRLAFMGIQMEGDFDFTGENGGGEYGLNGPGTLYRRDYLQGDRRTVSYIEEMALAGMDQSDGWALPDQVKIVANYPVRQPSVLSDAEFEDGYLITGNRYASSENCYGRLSYREDNSHEDIHVFESYESDGKITAGIYAMIPGQGDRFMGGIYYPSGNVEFAGICCFREELVYENGLYFDESGEVMGYYGNGEFFWLE